LRVVDLLSSWSCDCDRLRQVAERHILRHPNRLATMPAIRSPALGRVLAASLLFASSALSLPTELHIIIENREIASAAPLDWVTVGPSGAQTISPTVIGPDGATTTDQRAPESLTATGTYTLLPISAAPTTSTGLPPVATASSDGTGTHLACEVYTGVDAPFCAPKSGTQLNPGVTYFGQSLPALDLHRRSRSC
jgi:hypothetical protein